VPPDGLDLPRDAAQWFARMHSGEATDAERRAFAAWLQADPAHQREYRRLMRLWDAALAVPETRLRALMRDVPARPAPHWLPRRRACVGLAAACALAVVAELAGPMRHSGPAADVIELATRQGERREASLPDGSTLHLNSGTRLVVRFDKDSRRVALERGEAYFEVRHDAARPFVVDGGIGRVTVTGTRFDVRRDADLLRVSVESGSVRLAAGRGGWPAERRLAAGQQAAAHADGTLGGIMEVDVGRLAAWRGGKVVFDDMPLAAVIQEMNRYLPRPARLAAPGLDRYRVSGVFDIDDPQAMMAALPVIAPVAVERAVNGDLAVVAR